MNSRSDVFVRDKGSEMLTNKFKYEITTCDQVLKWFPHFPPLLGTWGLKELLED